MPSKRNKKVAEDSIILDTEGKELYKLPDEGFLRSMWLKLPDCLLRLFQGVDESDKLCAENDHEAIKAYIDLTEKVAEHPELADFCEKAQKKIEQVNVRAHETNLHKKEYSFLVIKHFCGLAIIAVCAWGEASGKFKITKLIGTLAA